MANATRGFCLAVAICINGSAMRGQSIDATRLDWVVGITCAPDNPSIGADSVRYEFVAASGSVHPTRTDGTGMTYRLTGKSRTLVFRGGAVADSTDAVGDSLMLRAEYDGELLVGGPGASEAAIPLQRTGSVPGVNGGTVYFGPLGHCHDFLPYSTATHDAMPIGVMTHWAAH